MTAGVACFTRGCTQPVIGQCQGYKGSCGQFYCAEHSTAKLCTDCAEKRLQEEAEQAQEAELDKIVSDYLQLAEKIHNGDELYENLKKELGFQGVEVKGKIVLTHWFIAIVGAIALNLNFTLFGILILVVNLFSIPIVISIFPYHRILNDSWKTRKGNLRSPGSFTGIVIMSLFIQSFLIMAVSFLYAIIGYFIIGLTEAFSYGEPERSFHLAIAGLIGAGIMLVIMLFVGNNNNNKIRQEVLSYLDSQKPGFKYFYQEWAKAKNKQDMEKLKNFAITALVVTGAVTAAATQQARDTQLGRDIHDIADAARRLKK